MNCKLFCVYRNYDEFSQGSAASHDDSYEQELRDYGYCQRERGDSSPSPGACEGETSSLRRSVAVVAARPAKSCSPGDKIPCGEDDSAYKRHSLQSVVVSSDVAAPSQLPPPPSSAQHPLDNRHLQKERVHILTLLEQLESSGDDDGGMVSSAPKKRLKLASDDCGEPPPSLPICAVGPVGMDVCYENHGDVGTPSLVVTTHNHRKSVSEVRRLSDVSSKHCSRRLSTDSTSKHSAGGRDICETSADRLVSVQSYSPHPVCKRRKTGSSTSESEDRGSCRSSKHSHHHHHHQHGESASGTLTISGGESVDGSRPGTPLCDERPENLLPPTEPRRLPRDRLATEGPLSLPLPRFAAQVLSSTARLSVSVSSVTPSASKAASVSSPPAVITSPRPVPSHSQPVVHQPSPSPIPAPPPASPPPRPESLLSSSSSDSELSPPSPTLEERIRSLDEKYEKWSGSRALSAAGGEALAKLDAAVGERFKFRHNLLDLDFNEIPPSDIVKSVLAKRSVFDEDSKRLENVSDKYEPREFVPHTRPLGFSSVRTTTECTRDFPSATPTRSVALVNDNASTAGTSGMSGRMTSVSNLPSRTAGTPPLQSPSHPPPRSPFSSSTPSTSGGLRSQMSPCPVGMSPMHGPCGSKLQQQQPQQQQQPVPKSPATGVPPAAKGLQYPFPSHPPVVPTTTVATTTATTAASLVSVSSAGVLPSSSVTVPTPATGTVLSPEVTRTCVARPVGPLTNTTTYLTEVSRSSVLRPSVTVLTTATGTKPTPEVTSRVPLKLVSPVSTTSSSTIGRVPSPGVLRLSTCVKPSTSTVTSVSVSTATVPDTLRTSTVCVKSSPVVSLPEVTRSQPLAAYTSARVLSTVIPSSQSTPKVSSTVASSLPANVKVPCTTSKSSSNVLSAVTTVASACSQALPPKSSKPVEQSVKSLKEHSPVAVRSDAPQSSNIPLVKSPSENPIMSCSPRVVIVPVSVTSTCAPTVTTVVASSTATTTVLTMTMASTVATSTTFTTSMSTPTTNSSSESTRLNLKPKSCPVSKKEQSSQPQSHPPCKDKQCDNGKQPAGLKKESLPAFSSSSLSSSKKDKDSGKEQDAKTISSSSHKSRTSVHVEEKRDRKESVVGSVCARRDSEKDGVHNDRLRERAESTEKDKRKDRESMEGAERDKRKDSHSMDSEKERRKDSVDSLEKEKRKDECIDNLDRRKDVEFGDKDRWKDGHVENIDKDRWKDVEENQEKDQQKENHMTDKEFESVIDTEKRTENAEKHKERRKERGSSSASPASIGCKRRMSSQDSMDSVPDDAKRLKLEHRKIAERRDSKDSGRSSSSSSKRSSSERPRSHGSAIATVNASANADTKSFAKLLEEKIREDKRQQGKDDPDRKKEGYDKHKSKDKQKKKNKSDRDSPKEMRDFGIKPAKDQTLDKDLSPKSGKKKDDSDPEDKDDGKHKHTKRETKEKKKQMKEEFGSSELLDEKGRVAKKDKDKRNNSERRKEEGMGKDDQKLASQKKDGKSQKKEFSNSDSESEDGSGDGPKKHSIFDIVDDGPAYISMYDKVKARSTKNMQKQEEERRQEMMREKFDLLKKKRAKREEKKRSTSWDEDSDSDNDHGSKCKRHVKLMISSSSEDDGRSRCDGDEPKLNKCKPVVRIKKEDICTGKSDSDSDVLGRTGKEVRRASMASKQDGSEDDDSLARSKHLTVPGKKGNRTKLISDTSEDDNAVARFKSNAHKMLDVYSADSDGDQGFADLDDKLPTSKKPAAKNNRVGKGALDSSIDESNKKLMSDVIKTGTDKQSSVKRGGNKNKLNKTVLDSSDDEYSRKFLSDVVKSDVYVDDKQASLKKSFVKNRTPKDSLDSSDDDSSRKLSDILKTDVYGNDKQLNLKKSCIKNKPQNTMDSSDDENIRKLLSAPKNDIFGEEKQALFRKSVLKNKTAKSFPDLTAEETTKKFLSDTEKADIFGENIQVEKCVMVQSKAAMALSTSSDCEVTAVTPPPQLDQKPSFHGNSIDKGNDMPRKKSHKKKQKRQKNLQSSEDGLGKVVSVESDLAVDKTEAIDNKPKVDGERKRHKRERRKSTHGKSIDSEDGKQTKARKKKVPKPELGALKPESSLKRDEKMEDIFGPLSDDSESGHVKTSITPNNGGSGRIYDKLPGKWQVSLVYGSDSDSNASFLGPRMECFTPAAAAAAAAATRPIEKERKRRDKRKRDKKASSVELVEAGRVLEAKLLSSGDYSDQALPKALLSSCKIEKREDGTLKEETGNNDVDVFRFTDGDESLEAATALLLEKAKEKRKKRKKSKEEKQSRREHHHHHHHDKSKSSPERKLSITSSLEDSKPSPLLSPSLSSLEMPVSPPFNKPAASLTPDEPLSVSPSPHDSLVLSVSTTTKIGEKKKPEKFIPGFGTAIDDIIHETAVKSISEFEVPKPKAELLVKEETDGKEEEGLPKTDDGLSNEEEKPRAVISQEETEDAVAALLGESFGADFTPSDCYVGEGNGSPPTTTHAGTERTLPTDEDEETRKAIEAIDMKPDTPQSESELQIDTDTDGGDPEPSYAGLRFSGEDHSPRTPDGIDFSRPPKTPDLPSSYYRQQQGVKSYEHESLLTKPTVQPESSPLIIKQMSPASESVEEKPVEPLECDQDQSLPEKPVSGQQPKPQSEPETEPDVAASAIGTTDNHGGHEQEEDMRVTSECDETVIPMPPCITFKPTEEVDGQDFDLVPGKPNDDGVASRDDNLENTKMQEDNTEVTHMCHKTEVELQVAPVEVPSLEVDPSSSHCHSPVISKSSPVPLLAPDDLSAEAPDTVKKHMDTSLKEEPKSQEENMDFGPYHFDKDAEGKETLTDSDITTFKSSESGAAIDRSYISSTKEDSGFVSVIKEEHASDIARESDFSEPETDMKADTDFVTNLLASESMSQALSIDDNSRSAPGASGGVDYSSFKEQEQEMKVVSVIKEPEHRIKTEEEENPFALPTPESPPSKESCETVVHYKDEKLDDKHDLTNAIKTDSSFWSAKEVNIESVIKKVNALCSGDEVTPRRDLPENVNERGNRIWFDQFEEKSVESSAHQVLKKDPEESVDEVFVNLQSQIELVKEEPELSPKDVDDTKKKDQIKSCEEQEISVTKSPSKELDSSAALSASPDEKDELILSSSSPEREQEQVTSSPDDESQETGTDVQSPVTGQTTPRSTTRGGRGGSRGKAHTRVTGVTTRRSRLVGGQKPAAEGISITSVSPRRGGRRSRGSGNKVALQDHMTSAASKKLTTDVYEFRDDSEDEGSNSGEKGRPRLILTIKSPQASVSASSVGGKEVQVAAKAAPVTVALPVVETREEFPSPATRKSRRLQERDGSRSTVDDVIEDVVRSSGKVTRSTAAAAAANAAANAAGLGLRPRRSTRQNVASQRSTAVVPEQPRKSPRGGKKQAQQRRLSESHEESSEEKKKQTDDEITAVKGSESPALDRDTENSSSKSPDSFSASGKTHQPEKDESEIPAESKATRTHVEEDDGEPTTLIDPVTGLLIPMRECEEGQYIPVTTAPVIMPVASTPQISTRSLSESQESPSTVVEPDKTRARAHSLPTIPSASMSYHQPSAQEGIPAVGVTQQSHVPVISNSVPKPLPTSVTTPPSPSIVGLRPIGICKSSVQTVASGTKSVPTTLKAHVLQQTAKTTLSQPVGTTTKVSQQVLPSLPPSATSTTSLSAVPQSPAMKVHTVAQPTVKGQAIPTTAPVSHPKTRDVLLHPTQTQPSSVGVAKSIQSVVPINPKTHLLQAVAGSKSPGGQAVVMTPGQGQMPVVSKIHHVSGPPPPQPQQMAVNMKAPSPGAHTPKAHLLQVATGGLPKTGSNFVPQQKPPHPAVMGAGGTKVPTSSPPQPPKAHHGPPQQPILTGAVASPPLKTHLSSQQPVVTGASSTRAAVPKSQVGFPLNSLVN